MPIYGRYSYILTCLIPSLSFPKKLNHVFLFISRQGKPLPSGRNGASVLFIHLIHPSASVFRKLPWLTLRRCLYLMDSQAHPLAFARAGGLVQPPPWGFSQIAKKRWRRLVLEYLFGQTLHNFWLKKIDQWQFTKKLIAGRDYFLS